MFFRDWFMGKLLKAHAKQKAKFPDEPELEAPHLTSAERLSLLFDGIKMIGSGNGAGALASVAAMNYFSSRADLHLPLKIAAIIFLAGLLVFALTIFGCIRGLSASMEFIERYVTPDAKNVSARALNRVADALIVLIFSVVGAFVSLACFFSGTAIALYALITF